MRCEVIVDDASSVSVPSPVVVVNGLGLVRERVLAPA
jgi:hypothetical protein